MKKTIEREKLISIALIVVGVLLLAQWQSVLKLAGVVAAGLGVFCLLREKKPDASAPLQQAQDEALSEEIRKIQNNIRLSKLGFLIACGVMLVLLFMSATVPGIIAALAGLGAKVAQEINEGKLHDYISNNIVRETLEAVFHIGEYRPVGHIAADTVRQSGFDVGTFDDMGGTNYVRGSYQGLPVELCDIQLIRTGYRTREDGMEEKTEGDVFKGFWLICDLGRPLAADLTLRERGKLGKLMGGRGIKTVSDPFNRQFFVDSGDEQAALDLLTPAVMEAIMAMDAQADGETWLRLDQAGRMHLAIRRENGLFGVGKRDRNAALVRQQFMRDLGSITGLIDLWR